MRRRAAAVTTALALTLLASACNDEPDDSSTGDATDPSVSTSGAPSDGPTEPTESATVTEPAEPTSTGDPGAGDSSTSRAKRAAIKAAALPGFNAEWTWQKRSSGPGPGQDIPSVCMVSSMTAIGAVEPEWRTDYESDLDPDSYAVVMTGVFPDELTVERSEGILASWLKGCAKQARSLGLKKVSVTPVRTVDTAVGPGRQRLVMYRPVAGDPDASWFQAEGYVRDGDTITYAIVTTAGQDYNYEVGAEPIDQILQVAADRLAKTRP